MEKEKNISGAKIVKTIKPQEGFQQKFVRSNVDVAFGGGILACGKSLYINELVCTPFGFRRIGDIEVGNTVTGVDGRMQRVIGVYPQGLLDVYKVTFTDGCYSLCSEEHLWNVRRMPVVTKRRKLMNGSFDDDWRVWTTGDIKKHIEKKSTQNIAIPLCSPVAFTVSTAQKGCTIDPYMLGLLLGDGCLTGTGAISLATTDMQFVEYIKSIGYEIHFANKDRCNYNFSYNKVLIDELKRLKLYGTYSDTKFVPHCYKFASIETRLEILRGLLDSDGTVGKSGTITYTSVSKQLAEDVQFIVRSLGGNATINTKNGRYFSEKYDKYIECKIAYNVTINIQDRTSLFKLERKKQRTSETHSGRNAPLTKRIVSCELVGKEECVCIKVNNPNGLFLTNDFIVTHNTFASCLLPAQWLRIGSFRACYTRRNLGDTKTGGGMVDEFRNIYGSEISVKESENPRIVYNSTGAWVDFTHIADENIKKLSERIKGWQYDLLYMDEITSYLEFSTFMIFATRVRGKAGIGSKIRGTTNPKKNHWIRKFIDWYIDEDGYIDPERDGVVRYFYIAGETVEDVVWGNTKKEVYELCSADIDKKIKALRNSVTYEDFIKSFVFYRGYLDENKAMFDGNKSYAGNIAMAGGKRSTAYIEGNWNIDEDEEEDSSIITINEAQKVFDNDAQSNCDWWITVDLAGQGKDNTVVIVWNGLHIVDIVTISTSTPMENATRVKIVAEKWNIAHSRIIFDATNGMYFKDYIPAAIAFTSRNSSRGLFKTTYPTMKDECAYRLVELIKSCGISFDREVADRQYKHKNLNSYMRIGTEFIQECNAIRFNEANSGKRTLFSKVEMNKILGKRRSMDIIDPCIMRMMPLLRMPLGEELTIDRIATNNYGNKYNIQSGAFGSWI